MRDIWRTEARKGVIAMIAACTIWGFSTLFYRALSDQPPLDVIAHRILWSFVFFAAYLGAQRRLGEVAAVLSDRKQVGWVALASVVISFNWFLFIFAVFIGKVSETSLGYYIFPLLSVLLGFVLFRERLSPAQWVAVALAGLAVLALTVGMGTPPWISLVLGITFAVYGAVKKATKAGGAVSVTAEVLLMLPFVAVWLWVFSTIPFRLDGTFLMLMISGPLTAGPLVLFSYAAKRIPLATLGVLQYINPTIQFLVAALILAEPMTVWHAVAFPMIWAALAIYSLSARRQDRRAATNAATEGTV